MENSEEVCNNIISLQRRMLRMIHNVPPGFNTLSQWNILGIAHQGQVIEKFLGYCHEDDHFRLSSQILEYDSDTNTGNTESGSKYFFQDKPGALHPLAQTYFVVVY